MEWRAKSYHIVIGWGSNLLLFVGYATLHVLLLRSLNDNVALKRIYIGDYSSKKDAFYVRNMLSFTSVKCMVEIIFIVV